MNMNYRLWTAICLRCFSVLATNFPLTDRARNPSWMPTSSATLFIDDDSCPHRQKNWYQSIVVHSAYSGVICWEFKVQLCNRDFVLYVQNVTQQRRYCECTRYKICKSFSNTKPFMARWRSANIPKASGGDRDEDRVAAPSWVGQYRSSK